MEELISICIPTFNGEKYLVESLDTVRNQTYQNLEILVIDDFSTDRTVEIIEEQAMNDSRIRLIRNEENIGLVPNWNRCLKEAKGNWIKFLFQDDLMDLDCCNKLLTFAKKNQLRVVLSDRTYFTASNNGELAKANSSQKKISHFFLNTGIIEAREMVSFFTTDFLGQNFLGEPIAGMVHKNVFKDYGLFNSTLKQIADFEFWLRVATNEAVGFINEPLNHFRIHDESQSSRNVATSKLNISWTDRIHLGLMIKHDNSYKEYRKECLNLGYSIDELLTEKFTYYIKEMGYFRTRKEVSSHAFNYFKHSLKNLKRAIQMDFSG